MDNAHEIIKKNNLNIKIVMKSFVHLPGDNELSGHLWYHFQIYFCNANLCIFMYASLKCAPIDPVYTSIGLDDGLVLNRWQAISWTNIHIQLYI